MSVFLTERGASPLSDSAPLAQGHVQHPGSVFSDLETFHNGAAGFYHLARAGALVSSSGGYAP